MGKSTLLKTIPSVIARSSVIDFECCGFAQDRGVLRMTARHLAGMHWSSPLFLGNAAADSKQIARQGFQIIGLHCSSEEKYGQRFREREIARGSREQPNWWQYHEKLFKVELPSQNTPPALLIDTMEERYEGKPELVAEAIREHFKLRRA